MTIKRANVVFMVTGIDMWEKNGKKANIPVTLANRKRKRIT